MCNICNYVSKRQTNLKRHMMSKRHHINKQNSNTTDITNSKSDMCTQENLDTEKYKCKYCEKLFLNKSSMYRHIRIFCPIVKNSAQTVPNNDINCNKKDLELIELKEQNRKLCNIIDKNTDAFNAIIKSLHNTIKKIQECSFNQNSRVLN